MAKHEHVMSCPNGPCTLKLNKPCLRGQALIDSRPPPVKIEKPCPEVRSAPDSDKFRWHPKAKRNKKQE